MTEAAAVRPRGRRLAGLMMIGALTLIAVVGFTALGVWQVHRRAWKLQLIAEIDSRIHATPVPAPGPPAWPAIDATHDAYRRITASGVFLNDRATLVQAATDLGSGYWVMTPLRTDAGFTILVNRGFVPPDRPNLIDLGEGPDAPRATVMGLLRVSEPKGGFLHSNDPADNRWYSRDVTAIADARHLQNVAPYFIDAEKTPPDQPGPVGGLTVINLPNNHLVYLLTWFTLAAMSAGGGIVAGVEASKGWALPRPARDQAPGGSGRR